MICCSRGLLHISEFSANVPTELVVGSDPLARVLYIPLHPAVTDRVRGADEGAVSSRPSHPSLEPSVIQAEAVGW